MNNVAKTGVVLGAGAGIALGGQYLYKRFADPHSSNDSILNQVVGAAANAANRTFSACSTAPVRTGYPVFNASRTIIDSTDNRQSNMTALQEIALGIFGSNNASDMVCTLASCESQNGDLRTDCFNCSLFNIHHPGCGNSTIVTERSPHGKPSVMKGTDRIISFITDEPNQVDGFRASLQHFHDFLSRKSAVIGHSFFADLETRNWNEFLIGLARADYGTMYKSAVVGGTVRDQFLLARYNRLIRAGLMRNWIE